jgi:hypothetical protein
MLMKAAIFEKLSLNSTYSVVIVEKKKPGRVGHYDWRGAYEDFA